MNNLQNKPTIRLLLVEDDQVSRLACKRALEKYLDCEFVVFEAETGGQGLKLARTEQIDCIVLDHNLPDFNGVEFLTELAGEAGGQPIPVLMLTGSDNAMLAVEALKLGAYDFVVKRSAQEPLQWLPPAILRALRGHQAIQDRAAATAQLSEAEAKYRTLVEQIPAITYIASLESPGKLSYISPQVQQLGFPPEEWLAYPEGLLQCLHEGDRPAVVEAYAQTCELHVPMRCEYRLVKHDGQVRWFLDEANVVFDEAGKALFLQGILVDITKDKEIELELSYYRKRLEELVAQRTEQLEKQNVILNSANANLAQALSDLKQADGEQRIAAAAFETQSGIIITDAKKKILKTNKAFTRITGHDAKYAIGKTPIVLRSGLHEEGFYEALWATVENAGYWEGEIWNKRKSGEVFPVWQTITKVTDKDGQATHYVGSFIDITAQKQAEKILLEARDRFECQVASTQEELEKTKAETTEINTTLNVLLKHREKDKDDAQISLSNEIETIVMPLLKRLKGTTNGQAQMLRMIVMVEDNLKNLMKSYGRAKHLDATYRKLSPIETQVASMVKLGQPTKVIAATLNITAGTVNIHRKHIRKKLDLDNKTNLQSYLQSLSD
jgi:PAS domain S-box-containing protein